MRPGFPAKGFQWTSMFFKLTISKSVLNWSVWILRVLWTLLLLSKVSFGFVLSIFRQNQASQMGSLEIFKAFFFFCKLEADWMHVGERGGHVGGGLQGQSPLWWIGACKPGEVGKFDILNFPLHRIHPRGRHIFIYQIQLLSARKRDQRHPALVRWWIVWRERRAACVVERGHWFERSEGGTDHQWLMLADCSDMSFVFVCWHTGCFF